MNIFNSLGSNYNPEYVMNSVYAEHKHARKKLRAYLEEVYAGQTVLFYKARTAITFALINSNLQEGSGVGVTGFTCIAVIDAIKKAKMRPIFLDIDPETLNFSAKALESKIKKEGIHAVIIQNTLGFPCDIESISRVCKKYKLVLIEDLAHSIGSIYANGKTAGTIGDFTVLSFSQDKVVDAVSGGALVSRVKGLIKEESSRNSEPSFQDKMYPFFTYSIRKTYKSGFGKFFHAFLRYTRLLANPMKNDIFKGLSDWHAQLALDGFLTLDKQLTHRRRVSKIYTNKINTTTQFNKLSKSIDKSTCLRFPIKILKRDEFIEFVKHNGLYISDTWYDTPIAPARYEARSGYEKGECPNSEKISNTLINLPTHINVSEQDALAIAQLVNTWQQKHK